MSLLEHQPNIRLFGLRPHAELARYIRGFGVGIVPYKLSEYTANVYPTKLNEYLVMGIPVVATDLPEIRRFNREHGEVVSVASGVDAFADAISNAIRGSSAGEVSRRIEVAHANSRSSRIAAMQTLIDEGLARRAATEQRWDTALLRAYHRTRGRAGRAKCQGGIYQAPMRQLLHPTGKKWRSYRPHARQRQIQQILLE